MPVSTLTRPDGHVIAYRRQAGRKPGAVFLGGFNSAMTGMKAEFLAGRCAAQDRAFLRFDYFGHGASSGDFAEGTVGRWRDDALAALDGLTQGPVVLIGSSMGAWIACLAALARPERIAGMIGIAAAPDFTHELLEPGLPDEARAALARDGVWLRPSLYGAPYPISRRLLEEGRDHRVLGGPIPVAGPVRLLHGLADPDVPADLSLRLAAAIDGPETSVTLIPDGDHRLSRDADLALLGYAVDQVLDDVPASAASPSR
jgi:pimeloyl-ACP methyl ester carboxylesterase